MKNINPLTAIDFYKADHRRQYPEGTTLVVSNLTPRSGKHGNVTDKSQVVFFGLQYFLKHFLGEVWQEGFFKRPKDEVVAEYKRRLDTSLGPDAVPVDHIVALHDLRHLPLEIRALPEGSLVPVGMPCLTLHNTHPDFFWLVNYLETVLSAYLWLPCTSATTAFNYRELLDSWAILTGSPPAFVDFQAHDFSFRGMGSYQSAVISGAAHLLFFKGTDTVPAIDLLEQYYGAKESNDLVGASVPATEHSVMCMGGALDEIGTFRRLITELYPKGIVSIVSDTWDFWKVIGEYATTLKPEIMARDGKLVFRPDSGNPADILCGADYVEYKWQDATLRRHPTPAEKKGAVEVLWDIFGGTITETGHKLLDSHVGLIYGDSITYDLAAKILERLEEKGFASANVVFGVGSFTYQYVTRDTWGFAVKATYGVVNGEARNIHKAPKTDSGKNSHKGLLLMEREGLGYRLTQEVAWEDFTDDSKNALQAVWRNGTLIREYTLAGLRGQV